MDYPEHDQETLERIPFALTIADIEQPDEPLVFVNRAFEKMTGYSRSAVLGRNCRFLQGEDTDPETVKELGRAIRAKESIEATIWNYRADGEGFWNRLVMSPLEDKEGHCRYFIGIQYDIGSQRNHVPRLEAEKQLAEVQHRVKNHLAMIVGMIRIQARTQTEAGKEFDQLARRVEALQLLYQEMDAAGAGSATDKIIPLGAYLSRISSALNYLDGRQGIKVQFQADEMAVEVETAARIGLIMSEILTNSLQHAFPDRQDGVVTLSARRMSGDLLRISMEDDGVGIPKDCNWPQEGNLGSRIVRQLVQGLGGQIDVIRGQVGTIINLDIPLGEQQRLITGEHEDRAGKEREDA
ncbi:PAS domain-containing protein [Qipengyuania sp.]|uniref:PAS domain-containing protein n=1 Tax=Qipengyuania sp. TaxID=2004515 RepID=UPI0035C7D858